MAYRPVTVHWQRPAIPKDILRQCTKRSDLQAWCHTLGVLTILATTGTFSFLMFRQQSWGWLALALYLHGAVWAFRPQIHEFSHRNVFNTRWLNPFWSFIFGCLHWDGRNPELYRLSHRYHHLYTLHAASDGEEVHPRAETSEVLFWDLIRVLDLTGMLRSLYIHFYTLVVPFSVNIHRSHWERYVYQQASEAERRAVRWHYRGQFLVHAVVGFFALLSDNGFLIVLFSLPHFYGCKWYARVVHDTMHVGCKPECDDFRDCCRSVKLDPFTSFLYWHMEYHAEHHAFAAIPCYHLKRFHQLTQNFWNKPQSLCQAWQEMSTHSRRLLQNEGIG